MKIRFETHLHDGVLIVYTRDQAEGAIPNGTLVYKCNSKKGEDAHGDGAPAHVLGSIDAGGIYGERYCYFVEWLDKPNVPYAIVGSRVRT